MTIRQVHRDDAITLEQYRAAEAAGLIRRPLTDRPIGADTTRRQNDAAASSVFTDPDRPAVTSNRRAVGPRGYATDRRTKENRT